MLAKSCDGDGGEHFHKTFKEEQELPHMMKTFLARSPEETRIDQWQSQILCRVLMKARVIYVSDADDQTVIDLHMMPAHTVDEAMARAVEIVGKEDYKVTVIPDGVSVMVGE